MKCPGLRNGSPAIPCLPSLSVGSSGARSWPPWGLAPLLYAICNVLLSFRAPIRGATLWQAPTSCRACTYAPTELLRRLRAPLFSASLLGLADALMFPCSACFLPQLSPYNGHSAG